MSMTDHPNPQMEDWLAAVTDALLADEDNLEQFAGRYYVPRYEATGLLALIRDLRASLTLRRPSRRYVLRLKYELLGEPPTHVVTRWRLLPARVHIAAGIALIAGVVLLNHRRFLPAAPRAEEPQEITA